MSKKNEFMIGNVLSIFLLIFVTNALGEDGILLDCKLNGGYPDAQIYINEKEGYVLYEIGGLKTYERKREYYTTDTDGNREATVIDDGLGITYTVDNRFILANDQRASFIYIKESGKFAYAWTTMIPMGESFAPFGNHHSGHCSSNPFNQPKSE